MALLTGALAVLVAGLAFGALKTQSKRFAVPAGETREKIVSCERGQAVAGGFRAPIPGGNGPFMLPLDSTREGSGGWRLRTQNSGKAGKASVYVYCRRAGPLLTTASSAPTIIAKDEQKTIAAQCGPGEEAVAGGFESPDVQTYPLASKRTASDTWEVTLLNNGEVPHQYTAFAYCDSSEPGLTTKTKTGTADGNSERFSQSVAARCKRSQTLRSGGFEIEYRVDPIAENSDLGLVHASRRDGERRWRLTAFAFLGSPEMTAYAYCK